jgi:hypothetical protein
MKPKLPLLVGISLGVIALCVVLTHQRQSRSRQSRSVGQVEVRGEAIKPVASSETQSGAQLVSNAPPKRKHDKPASVQRRMLMAQLAQSADDTNAAITGTAGTAADWAKIKARGLTNLPPIEVSAPGYSNITFATLGGFNFGLEKEIVRGTDATETSAQARSRIPQEIQSLDGRKAVIEGFLLPVKMNNGLAIEFLLMRNQSMCCYGVAPRINEWVTVLLKGEGVKPLMDRPVAVAGTLHVGPTLENGLLTGIYVLDGEKVIGPN